MKLSIELDGQPCTLELECSGSTARYSLSGALEASGIASISEIAPGVFSILLGSRSIEVRLQSAPDSLEAWAGGRRYQVAVSDARDRSTRSRKSGAAGPVELRAQMPGKVITVLVAPGASVHAGQGLIVVEAMKMQNEVKSPKDGVVSKIYAAAGSTVAAGEALLVVE
jgi:biotin carboxyl carrier protein